MKALTDEQIEEVRRRYAAGESKLALGEAFHVSDVTIGRFVRGVTREDLYPPENPVPAAEPQQDLEPAAEAQREAEPADETKPEPEPQTTELYEIARGFETFVLQHTAGDFSISVSRSNGVILITAAAGDEEITVKRKERSKRPDSDA